MNKRRAQWLAAVGSARRRCVSRSLKQLSCLRQNSYQRVTFSVRSEWLSQLGMLYHWMHYNAKWTAGNNQGRPKPLHDMHHSFPLCHFVFSLPSCSMMSMKDWVESCLWTARYFLFSSQSVKQIVGLTLWINFSAVCNWLRKHLDFDVSSSRISKN